MNDNQDQSEDAKINELTPKVTGIGGIFFFQIIQIKQKTGTLKIWVWK